MIGPGGENLVKYACVMNELKDAAGRTGMGAVMGSKKLKAVAVRGTHEPRRRRPGRRSARWRAQLAKEVRDGTRAAGLPQAGTGGGDLTGGLLQGNLPIHNFRDGEWAGIERPELYHGQDRHPAWRPARPAPCAARRWSRREGVDSDYGGARVRDAGRAGLLLRRRRPGGRLQGQPALQRQLAGHHRRRRDHRPGDGGLRERPADAGGHRRHRPALWQWRGHGRR